jgi:hypothetical protein
MVGPHFPDVPEKVRLSGAFAPSCLFSFSEKARSALASGRLKLQIENFRFSTQAVLVNITISVGGDNCSVTMDARASGNYEMRLWR